MTVADRTDFPVVRLTLSNDAAGRLAYFSSFIGELDSETISYYEFANGRDFTLLSDPPPPPPVDPPPVDPPPVDPPPIDPPPVDPPPVDPPPVDPPPVDPPPVDPPPVDPPPVDPPPVDPPPVDPPPVDPPPVDPPPVDPPPVDPPPVDPPNPPTPGGGFPPTGSAFGVDRTIVEIDGAQHVVNDLSINFDGRLGGQQMLVELTSGAIYQTPAVGGDSAPNGAFVGLVPELAYDSFVTMGGLTQESSEGILVVGGAVNIPGGDSDVQFDTSRANITWAAAPGVGLFDAQDFLVSRLTLSADAEGYIYYFSSAGGDNSLTFAPIVNGFVGLGFIPEPTAGLLVMLTTALVASHARCRD